MRWRYRQATDPREEVYGLVGLIPPDSLSGNHALRDVSYSVTPVALFARVTLDLIQSDKDLGSFVGARELSHITPLYQHGRLTSRVPAPLENGRQNGGNILTVTFTGQPPRDWTCDLKLQWTIRH